MLACFGHGPGGWKGPWPWEREGSSGADMRSLGSESDWTTLTGSGQSSTSPNYGPQPEGACEFESRMCLFHLVWLGAGQVENILTMCGKPGWQQTPPRFISNLRVKTSLVRVAGRFDAGDTFVGTQCAWLPPPARPCPARLCGAVLTISTHCEGASVDISHSVEEGTSAKKPEKCNKKQVPDEKVSSWDNWHR